MVETPDDDVSLLDYLHVLVRRRWMITCLVLVACLIAGGVSLLLPKAYRARATVLPPEARSSSLNLGALLSNSPLPLTGLGLPEFSNTSELFVQILTSRSIAEQIIHQFHLMQVYHARNLEEAVERLHREARFKVEKAGVISITVKAPTARLAADMANAFVEELDRFNREKNMTTAKSTRLFIEQRLEEGKRDLSKALTDLQTFQERNQLVSLTEQAKAAVEAAAGVESQLRLLEFDLAVKRKTLYPAHPEVIQAQTQIEELRKQLNRLKFGDGSVGTSAAVEKPNLDGFHLSFASMPALQLQLGQLTMEVKVQQSIVEILFQQYEQARIQEVRDTPTVRRLDAAVPPEGRSSPHRTMIVIVTGVCSLFFSIMLAFLLDYGQRAAHEGDDSQKVAQMTSMLRSDYLRLKQLVNGKQSLPSSRPFPTPQEPDTHDAHRSEG